MFVEGDRVSLHTVVAEDYEFLAEHRNRPTIRRGFAQAEPLGREHFESVVADDEDAVEFMVCQAGQPVGYAWVFRMDDVARNGLIGYWIAESEQGEGYATETVDLLCEWGFEDRGLHKLGAHAFETNEASQAVLEANGFQREGVIRDEYFVDGEFVDAISYGLLEDEWRSDG